jgi:hypothetical protein
MLEDFKRIATLQTVAVTLPGEQPTDYAGGSSVAGRLGMGRLSERLAKLATA